MKIQNSCILGEPKLTPRDINKLRAGEPDRIHTRKMVSKTPREKLDPENKFKI